jgi:hypothetical protein
LSNVPETSFVGCVRGVLVCLVEQPETMVIFRRRGLAFVTRDMSEKQFLAALERHGMKCEGFMGYVNLGILGHRPISIGTRLGQAPT